MTYQVKITEEANGVKVASLFLNTVCSIMIDDAKFSMGNEIKGLGDITSVSMHGCTVLTATIKQH